MSSSIARRSAPSAESSFGRPSSKRIKCGDDQDIGHPIEDEVSAKKKLQEAGFDPDRVSKPARNLRNFVKLGLTLCTPMAYFSYMNDLPMCRYLYLNGARDDVTCSRGTHWSPMKAAAYAGNLSVCKWLYEHGAADDVCGRTVLPKTIWSAYSPLARAGMNGQNQVCQWLILKGALHSKPGRKFDESAARYFLRSVGKDDREFIFSLKSWPQEAISAYEAFRVFLLGTLPAPAADRSATLKLILTRKLQSENERSEDSFRKYSA